MRTRNLLAAAAGALAATVLAGVAWAGIPGADGVINGCYQKVEGQLRVIDPDADHCRPSEVGITWNGQGREGEKGQPGEPGTPGGDGADGRDGTGVTVQPEPPGPNCPGGGVKVSDADDGVAYVCEPLPPPDPGEDD
jgi:hypothetical protein